MEKNSEIVSLGAGAAVLGHPAAVVAMMVNQSKEEIPAGAVLLAACGKSAVVRNTGTASLFPVHPCADSKPFLGAKQAGCPRFSKRNDFCHRLLAGAITEAVAVKAGDSITLRMQHMGCVSVSFV